MLYYCTENCKEVKYNCNVSKIGERICPDCEMAVLGLTFSYDNKVNLPRYWKEDTKEEIIKSLKEIGEYNGSASVL